ncbi:MAG: SPOR domain-containing protein [Rhodocyclaceae bacterium]|nr:SPOR domain-containing protein [Rhodocyclaceae bacterium]MCB1963338.1 SPOR domain-containing protein [Rhodocyclaceae bacterium]
MANDDAQTDLKKRARRRLVGAAALALFAVIVLPMIMDPEPKPVGEEIQVTIPGQDGSNFAARRLEATPPVAVAPPTAPTPSAVVEPVAPPPAPPAPQAPPKTEPVAPPEVDQNAEQKRVEAILAGKLSDGAKREPGVGGFVVQVGAYSKAGSATEVMNMVRAKGFEVFTRKIGSTTRVRVGPFETRDAAERAAKKLAAQGYKGVVMPQG